MSTTGAHIMFEEHSRVVLRTCVRELGLEPGTVGVVVHVHGRGAAYEVEFLLPDGLTIGVATVEAAGLEQVSVTEPS